MECSSNVQVNQEMFLIHKKKKKKNCSVIFFLIYIWIDKIADES